MRLVTISVSCHVVFDSAKRLEQANKRTNIQEKREKGRQAGERSGGRAGRIKGTQTNENTNRDKRINKPKTHKNTGNKTDLRPNG